MIWKNQRRPVDLSNHSVIMGILNTTPDSFSDGGQNAVAGAALEHALEMIEQGAEIIDIGGESTRPGSTPVSEDEEIGRTIPVISALRDQSDVLISIDTSKPAVAEAALAAGADIINDVTGLRDPQMIDLAVSSGAGLCVMHMKGEPKTMQQNPDYSEKGGVIAEVEGFFRERLETLGNAGVDIDCICFDPGIGFGKSLEHNMELLRGLGSLQVDRPILLGASRKSCLGAITGIQNPAERDTATAVVTALAAAQGIRLHRVHDVAICRQALQLASSLCP